MFYRVRVRVEFQKVLREIGMSGDPDDCHLTHLINVQGIRNHGIEAKKLNLSIRDAVFYCIDHVFEEFEENDFIKMEAMDLDKNEKTGNFYNSSVLVRYDLTVSLNNEYKDKEKPW